MVNLNNIRLDSSSISDYHHYYFNYYDFFPFYYYGYDYNYYGYDYNYYGYGYNYYDYGYNYYGYSNITSDHSNITSDHSNITSDHSNIISDHSNTSNHSNNTGDFDFHKNAHFIMDVLTCIIIAVGLPLTLLAIYALYSQVRNDHVAPIYVINLLISDLIQLCCMIVQVARPEDQKIVVIFSYICYADLIASIGFMVCVALERYLVIACPLWYHIRRTIKISVMVCVLVWVLPFFVVPIFYFWVPYQVRYNVFSIFLLLPLPLFIFFLGGVLKALSASISVTSDEKRRIVGVLVLVLLIYTLLFLPNIILYLSKKGLNNITLLRVSLTFFRLNPLANAALYVFMRKGIIDKLLSSVCCCRMDSNDINSPSV